MSRSRDVGTRAETALAGYLTAETGELFERGALRGRFDKGDLHAHNVNIAIEAKAAKVLNLKKWVEELAAEMANKHVDLGVIIWKPPGVGYTRIQEWIAIEWAPAALPATRRRRIPHVGPINQIHNYVTKAANWGPVYTDITGRTPTPGDENWLRLQHLHHWVEALGEHLAGIRH